LALAGGGDMGRERRWPARVGAAIVVLWFAGPAAGQDPTCTRDAFEQAVGLSAAALRDLTGQNRPVFQTRLRELKDKRGWDHSQFLREAAPIVQDERTDAYDNESATLSSAWAPKAPPRRRPIARRSPASRATCRRWSMPSAASGPI